MFQEMKKFMMAIAVMVMAICATAQTVEKSYVFDNTEIGIKGGVSALVQDRKSTRLNSSHMIGLISYAVFCLKKKKKK